MARFAVSALAVFGLVGGSAPAGAESGGYMLSALVPASCQVSHSQNQFAMAGAGVPLGELSEYCNAAHGYELVVSYAPGTMQGAILSLGDDRVVLNGSGQAVISRASGARIRHRALTAIPGEAGFDTDRLDFRVQLL